MPEMERLPISPDVVTVLGSRVKAGDARWCGLDFSRASVRTQSTLMLYVCGKDAPYDLHLRVAFHHTEDPPGDDLDCWYRVRPRMEAGRKWRGRKVATVEIEPAPDLTPPFAISVTYACPQASPPDIGSSDAC